MLRIHNSGEGVIAVGSVNVAANEGYLLRRRSTPFIRLHMHLSGYLVLVGQLQRKSRNTFACWRGAQCCELPWS